MSTYYASTMEWLQRYPDLLIVISLLGLVLLAWLANWIVKRILLRGIYRIMRGNQGSTSAVEESGIIARTSNVVPAVIISAGIELIPGLPEAVVTIVQNVCGAFVVLTLALAAVGVMNLVNTLYQRRPDAHLRPIKGYIQVVNIIIYAVAAILIVASLVDRDPLILLSGLGALAAVLMLIFQDTLLSLVASVQISSNDIMRVGDWVEMPALNADGAVIDIALHTVKIQNWDKTITTIPTKRFITDPFKNWRGMSESGGRRIKRALYLDQHSVHFVRGEERLALQRFYLLKDYLDDKQIEIDAWNRQQEEAGREPVNNRCVTNLGSFRAYVERYLRNHAGINRDMTLMVRQLAPGDNGLPLELYCFTRSTAWVDYEGVQADIFDHLLAILPEFGLRVFQHPSGNDMRELGRLLSSARESSPASPAALQ